MSILSHTEYRVEDTEIAECVAPPTRRIGLVCRFITMTHYYYGRGGETVNAQGGEMLTLWHVDATAKARSVSPGDGIALVQRKNDGETTTEVLWRPRCVGADGVQHSLGALL